MFIFVLLGTNSLKDEKNKFDPYSDSSLVLKHLKDISRFVVLAEQKCSFVRVVPFAIGITTNSKYRHRYENFVNAAIVFKIPVLSLESAFQDYKFSDLRVNKLDGHPNELANSVAAKETARQIFRDMKGI